MYLNTKFLFGIESIKSEAMGCRGSAPIGPVPPPSSPAELYKRRREATALAFATSSPPISPTEASSTSIQDRQVMQLAAAAAAAAVRRRQQERDDEAGDYSLELQLKMDPTLQRRLQSQQFEQRRTFSRRQYVRIAHVESDVDEEEKEETEEEEPKNNFLSVPGVASPRTPRPSPMSTRPGFAAPTPIFI